MAAPIISILSDSFEESVGSHAPRVILFGAIPAIIPIIPKVPIVPVDPIVAPKADGESEPAEQRPVSSSHDTLAPLSEFPLAPVVAPPRIRRRPVILVRPGEAIPFGRLYRTHLNGPHKLLTARKRVRPIPGRRLAWRRVSHHSSDRHSSLDTYSSNSPSDHSLSGHTPPDTTDDDSSAPLSTPYPPNTSESSLGSSSKRSLDSSLPFSGPSRKRCRSSTDSVPSPTHVLRLIAPTPADLLPPHKSDGVVAHPEDVVGIRVEIAASDVREDDEEFEADASTADTREIVVDPLAIGDSSESSRGGIHDLEDTIYDIVHYMSEIDNLRWHMALSQEVFLQVCKDRDDTRRRLRRLESYVERHLGFRP
ncbi:hypothetical protein Tco_0869009 [Tanacetum coccineum]